MLNKSDRDHPHKYQWDPIWFPARDKNLISLEITGYMNFHVYCISWTSLEVTVPQPHPLAETKTVDLRLTFFLLINF